ncbi:Solute carrier family 25 member 8 [Intoshia linei]|uniref:Solute carrier family 25 member 8 n=1 Tax=Intoshia linei TaxID=1819745 RepID=A0A177AVU8_9BILA|nr:Solute carrier family 25 member 8 [Intoshia linei]
MSTRRRYLINKLKHIFESCDTEKKGYLTVNQFTNYCNANLCDKNELDSNITSNLVILLDPENSGCIYFNKFKIHIDTFLESNEIEKRQNMISTHSQDIKNHSSDSDSDINQDGLDSNKSSFYRSTFHRYTKSNESCKDIKKEIPSNVSNQFKLIVENDIYDLSDELKLVKNQLNELTQRQGSNDSKQYLIKNQNGEIMDSILDLEYKTTELNLSKKENLKCIEALREKNKELNNDIIEYKERNIELEIENHNMLKEKNDLSNEMKNKINEVKRINDIMNNSVNEICLDCQDYIKKIDTLKEINETLQCHSELAELKNVNSALIRIELVTLKITYKLKSELELKKINKNAKKTKSMVQRQVEQNKKNNLLNLSIKIVRNNGPFALYSGLPASMLRQMTSTASRFGVYELIKQNYTSDNKKFSLIDKIMSASVGGLVAGIVGCPADVINVRMQTDAISENKRYKNLLDAFKKIYKINGISQFFNGCSMASTRAIFITVAQLATYDEFKGFIVQRTTYFKDDEKITHLTASLIAKFNDFYLSLKKLGIFGFFKGFVPAFVRLGPHTILTFMFMEQLRLKFGYIDSAVL